MSSVDVIVVGAGPAGMFCAQELRRAGVQDVLVLDEGRALKDRVCPTTALCECSPCDVLCGEGGAGGFSDGKITLSALRGTHQESIFPTSQAADLKRVEELIVELGRPGIAHGEEDGIRLVGPLAHQLRLESYPLRHVGSDGIREFTTAFTRALQRDGVEFRLRTRAEQLIVRNGRVLGLGVRDVKTGKEACLSSAQVCLATGLAGTTWCEEQLSAIGVALETGPADIGVRIEMPAEILEPLTSQFYDFKVQLSRGGLKLRSFCVNANGFVTNEYHQSLGIRAVNGHSFLDLRTVRSNLAVLAKFERAIVPDPKAFVRSLALRINQAAEGYPAVQRLDDFLRQREPRIASDPEENSPSNPKARSTNLAAVLPSNLYEAVAWYIGELARVVSIRRREEQIFVYGPEVKYFGYRVPLDFETWQPRGVYSLRVVGNASGYTASFAAAAISGMAAGRSIAGEVLG